MKGVKKFVRGLVIPVLIGIAMGIFIARVVGPAFDLGRQEIAITTALTASVFVVIYLIITTRKKK